MAAPTTTKRPYKSRLDPDLIGASPGRLIREERLLLLRRVDKWLRSHRYAPTPPDLLRKYPDMGENALIVRIRDLCAEGLAVRQGPGLMPTAEGWSLIGKEPLDALFSSEANERAAQYRMCHYVYEAQRTDRFADMYTHWLRGRHAPKKETDDAC